MKKIYLAFLLTLISLEARALNVALGDSRDWSFHDLKGETEISAFMGGAVASITHAAAKDKSPDASVFIYKSSAKVKEDLGANLQRWQAAVIGDKRPGRIIKTQKIIKVGAESRYYVEMQEDSNAHRQIYTTLMAIQRDGFVFVFSFQDEHDIYTKSQARVKELYHALTIKSS